MQPQFLFFFSEGSSSCSVTKPIFKVQQLICSLFSLDIEVFVLLNPFSTLIIMKQGGAVSIIGCKFHCRQTVSTFSQSI